MRTNNPFHNLPINADDCAVSYNNVSRAEVNTRQASSKQASTTQDNYGLSNSQLHGSYTLATMQESLPSLDEIKRFRDYFLALSSGTAGITPNNINKHELAKKVEELMDCTLAIHNFINLIPKQFQCLFNRNSKPLVAHYFKVSGHVEGNCSQRIDFLANCFQQLINNGTYGGQKLIVPGGKLFSWIQQTKYPSGVVVLQIAKQIITVRLPLMPSSIDMDALYALLVMRDNSGVYHGLVKRLEKIGNTDKHDEASFKPEFFRKQAESMRFLGY